jgi:hypothetical protein
MRRIVPIRSGPIAMPFLITLDDLEWRRVVRDLDRQMTLEMDYAQELGANWHEAWIWGVRAPRGSHWGFAAFSMDYTPPALARVWLMPVMRRRGHLRAAWPAWRERYGAFTVINPSEAMQAFLALVGYRPAPSVVEGMQSPFWVPRRS